MRYRLRQAAYAPLLFLERLPLFRRWWAPFLRNVEADGFALFARTHGLHGAAIDAMIDVLKRRGAYRPGHRVLVLGVGQGRELECWRREQPGCIVGQDVLDFTADWQPRAQGAVTFCQSDLRSLPFADGSFDLVVSKAVFEHVAEPEPCLVEIRRVLRAGGAMWADFGPLWCCWCGAHDRCDYDHLLHPYEELDRILEPASEGAFYWHQGMFSRLRVREYQALFARYFDLERWHVAVRPQAEKFRQANPATWRRLLEKEREEDLHLYAIFALGRKTGP